jgi:hypothetical protein
VGPGIQHAAVYPGLAAGDYVIWRDPGTPAATITIGEGRVTTFHWGASPGTAAP